MKVKVWLSDFLFLCVFLGISKGKRVIVNYILYILGQTLNDLTLLCLNDKNNVLELIVEYTLRVHGTFFIIELNSKSQSKLVAYTRQEIVLYCILCTLL